jgi:hypothetical protein
LWRFFAQCAEPAASFNALIGGVFLASAGAVRRESRRGKETRADADLAGRLLVALS